MNIDETNITMIHGLLIDDLKTRLFKQHNEIKVRNPFTIVTDDDHQDDIAQMVSWVHKCVSVSDINELVISYQDLFDTYGDIGVCTLEGTMNYIFKLLR